MADTTQASFREQLKQFELPDIEFTDEVLGEGSYGCVKVVKMPGARCVAKIIHESLVQNVPAQQMRPRGGEYMPRSLIKSFEEECTLMSKLRHPHIVQFFGICYPKGARLPALVMELLMTSLHDYLESETKKGEIIPMAIKRGILLDISQGLVYLHHRDVVHRDLTAANVLLSESLAAKIADLGMARLVKLEAGRAMRMTKAPGNASYMPPEACDGSEYAAQYNKSIDSFSMGHIILFTVTQEFPEPTAPTYRDKRTGRTIGRTAIERRAKSFIDLHKVVEEGSPLSRLAYSCLQDDPNARPTAVKITHEIEGMSTVPFRSWEQSKPELIQEVLDSESRVSELEEEVLKRDSTIVQLQQGVRKE